MTGVAVSSPRVQELFDLQGRVAIVTGGARNLGLQMAQALAEVGATVVVTARHTPAASDAARELADSYGVKTLGMPLQITDESSWSELVSTVVSQLGRIDVLVNNAGGRDAKAVEPHPEVAPDVPFLEE